MREIFEPLYATWSGPGSTLEYSAPYRKFLGRFIRERGIESIIDLGCGDMEVMGNVELHGASYHGVDCIPSRIDLNRAKYPQHRFTCADLRTVELDAQLVVCKDVLQHWSTPDILRWLPVLDGKLALITNCATSVLNSDIKTGGYRTLGLTKQPFNLGVDFFRWGTKATVLVDRRGNATGTSP